VISVLQVTQLVSVLKIQACVFFAPVITVIRVLTVTPAAVSALLDEVFNTLTIGSDAFNYFKK